MENVRIPSGLKRKYLKLRNRGYTHDEAISKLNRGGIGKIVGGSIMGLSGAGHIYTGYKIHKGINNMTNSHNLTHESDRRTANIVKGIGHAFTTVPGIGLVAGGGSLVASGIIRRNRLKNKAVVNALQNEWTNLRKDRQN